MARMPGATWVGPTSNEVAGGMSQVLGVCLHIQQGSEAGSIAWERDPKSQVSSHFLVDLDGHIDQMVDTADRAWCEVAGNRHFISVELAGYTGHPMTSAQSAACSQILAWAHRTHGVAVRVCDNPSPPQQSEGGLVYHRLGGIAWGDHPDCPGNPIIAQRPDVVAYANTLINGGNVSGPVNINLDETMQVNDGETKSLRQEDADDWSALWRGEGPWFSWVKAQFEALAAGQAEILAAIKAITPTPPAPPVA